MPAVCGRPAGAWVQRSNGWPVERPGSWRTHLPSRRTGWQPRCGPPPPTKPAPISCAGACWWKTSSPPASASRRRPERSAPARPAADGTGQDRGGGRDRSRPAGVTPGRGGGRHGADESRASGGAGRSGGAPGGRGPSGGGGATGRGRGGGGRGGRGPAAGGGGGEPPGRRRGHRRNGGRRDVAPASLGEDQDGGATSVPLTNTVIGTTGRRLEGPGRNFFPDSRGHPYPGGVPQGAAAVVVVVGAGCSGVGVPAGTTTTTPDVPCPPGAPLVLE